MSYYRFRYAGVVSNDSDYVDLEFTDDQYGNNMRQWVLSYDRDWDKLTGSLRMAENDQQSFDDYREATPVEMDQMWSLVPESVKHEFKLVRK